jgi:bifunctional DNA-binding transcriptional regulator/antitoxin component of YhaV-PrlF toxin-antitoxin module
MKTTLSSKGQIVLAAELRELDRIAPGQQFEIERLQSGEHLLRKVSAPTVSMVDWLQRCPEKDWFQPLPSESTDTL